ncbi:hypothetical protein Tco_1435618 [Tanacetum coccineum]
MACLLPHTVDEIKAMIQKQIEEDKVCQLAIINLAVEYDNTCTTKDDLRKAYEECNDIPQEKLREKKWEERIKQEEARDELFKLEFGVISDSESD